MVATGRSVPATASERGHVGPHGLPYAVNCSILFTELPLDEISELEKLEGAGYWVAGLAGEADAQDLFETDLPEPLALVVGSEGKGLSRLVTENCDQIVSIPIDSTMESLNASMAVGITLYEVSRRRAGS